MEPSMVPLECASMACRLMPFPNMQTRCGRGRTNNAFACAPSVLHRLRACPPRQRQACCCGRISSGSPRARPPRHTRSRAPRSRRRASLRAPTRTPCPRLSTACADLARMRADTLSPVTTYTDARADGGCAIVLSGRSMPLEHAAVATHQQAAPTHVRVQLSVSKLKQEPLLRIHRTHLGHRDPKQPACQSAPLR